MASSPSLAASIYRQVARVTAKALASGGLVESVFLRRSAATGEVQFGRSDIDLSLIVCDQVADDESEIETLYRKARTLKRFVPRLDHMEVHEPGGMQEIARMDTFWGSLERRSLVLLHGAPIGLPCLPVHPDHAVSRFALWVEWFFSESVQRKSARNIRKTALENWTAYATASGLIEEPFLVRTDMEAHIRQAERGVDTRRLGEPGYAAAVVFGFADRLHRTRLPQLQKLAAPHVFEAVLPPLASRRLFVVLPRADSLLPPEAFAPGAFLCTPEALHLHLHYTNAFLYWALPPTILDLGVKPPTVHGFLKACCRFGHNRFLRHPGFALNNTWMPSARTACVRHALEWASRGELPPAIPQKELRDMIENRPTCLEYYRTIYAPLRRESALLRESALSLLDDT